ncbi:uncharacterized protein LOC113315294 [Papaver somniferum]|uniref:uncharacterized protein LOC113315294 n=1 Tax=Papaver somniferum TaxID=3469 RepID=UPI000E702C3F|nr:uncharacterized protein LOC113315294 [Papaver somniferum]
MEAFSRQLIQAEQCNKIQGIKIAAGAPSISHLFLTDDCLLFINADMHNVNNLLDIIKDFGEASGQLVNFNKSSVYYSVHIPQRFCRLLIRWLKVPRMKSNERYLGLPLLIGKQKITCFTGFVDRVKGRLSKWNGDNMSQFCKSLMKKTITNIILVYSMSCLQLPVDTIEKIDTLQRDFWWGFTEKRGTYITSWKKLCLHKNLGGQGFRDLKILNQALLVMKAWRMCINPDDKWVKAMQAKYFPYTSMIHASSKSNFSWAWKGVQKQISFIKVNSRWKF